MQKLLRISLMKNKFDIVSLFLFFSLIIMVPLNIIAAEKILNRGNGAEPDTLDPHLATGHWEGSIINDIFVGLFTKGEDGSSIKGSVKSYTKSENGLKSVSYTHLTLPTKRIV